MTAADLNRLFASTDEPEGLMSWKRCPVCSGHGFVPAKPCPTCKGEGVVAK